MTPSQVKIKGGALRIPKPFQSDWQNVDAFVVPSATSLYIKKLSDTDQSQIESKLAKLGRLVSKKDLEDAVSWAREKIYQGHS